MLPAKMRQTWALVIDTLDLLHSGIYDAFVIVASDSDYTPLAIKLRESGVFVRESVKKRHRNLSAMPVTNLSILKT